MRPIEIILAPDGARHACYTCEMSAVSRRARHLLARFLSRIASRLYFQISENCPTFLSFTDLGTIRKTRKRITKSLFHPKNMGSNVIKTMKMVSDRK